MTTTARHHVLALRPGLELTVREGGEGPPVLLLHGAPGPGSLTPLAEHLAARHRVLLPVHPGWEGTARPAGLDSVPNLAETYLQLLDRLGLGPVALLGTSFGGWVAAETALRDTRGHIERLVLMNAIGPAVPGHAVAVPPPPPRAPGTPAGATPRGPSPASLEALRAYGGADLRDPGLLDRLGAVTRPVLVVWGEDDPVVGPAYGRAYADAFPDARFTLVPGAGHLPLRERPEATFAAVDGFLDAPPPSPPAPPA